MKKFKFNRKYLKVGAYTAVVCAVSIVMAVVVNLIVGALPERILKLDTSANGLYEITEQTKEIIKSIDKNITVNLVAQNGNEDKTIIEYCKKYAEMNGRITFKTVDPALEPSFVSKYTDEDVTENSLIVVCEDNQRAKVILNSKIYSVQYSDEEIYNYYYYGITPTGTTTFMIEK